LSFLRPASEKGEAGLGEGRLHLLGHEHRARPRAVGDARRQVHRAPEPVAAEVDRLPAGDPRPDLREGLPLGVGGGDEVQRGAHHGLGVAARQHRRVADELHEADGRRGHIPRELAEPPPHRARLLGGHLLPEAGEAHEVGEGDRHLRTRGAGEREHVGAHLGAQVLEEDVLQQGADRGRARHLREAQAGVALRVLRRAELAPHHAAHGLGDLGEIAPDDPGEVELLLEVHAGRREDLRRGDPGDVTLGEQPLVGGGQRESERLAEALDDLGVDPRGRGRLAQGEALPLAHERALEREQREAFLGAGLPELLDRDAARMELREQLDPPAARVLVVQALEEPLSSQSGVTRVGGIISSASGSAP